MQSSLWATWIGGFLNAETGLQTWLCFCYLLDGGILWASRWLSQLNSVFLEIISFVLVWEPLELSGICPCIWPYWACWRHQLCSRRTNKGISVGVTWPVTSRAGVWGAHCRIWALFPVRERILPGGIFPRLWVTPPPPKEKPVDGLKWCGVSTWLTIRISAQILLLLSPQQDI